MAATALAQQSVDDSLAAAHTSTAEARTSQPPAEATAIPHPLCVRPNSTLRYRRCYHTPFYHTPPPRTPSCGCAEVISHPVVYHTPFVAPASCTLSPGLHNNRQIYPLERIYSLHAQIAPPPPPPRPLKARSLLIKTRPPRSSKPAPPPHWLFDLQDSLDKRIHFPPQLSDFVLLRNGFYSFRAQTD